MNDIDIELLKKVASLLDLNVKGIRVDLDDNPIGLVVGKRNTKEKILWSPLLDNGDAFKLLSKLELNLLFRVHDDCKWVEVFPSFDTDEYQAILPVRSYYKVDHSDKEKAIRRAIVLMAAAIQAYREEE
jgi:hypothetical protein